MAKSFLSNEQFLNYFGSLDAAGQAQCLSDGWQIDGPPNVGAAGGGDYVVSLETSMSNLEDVTISSTRNNWSPNNWLTRSGIRLTDLNGNTRSITGFAAPSSGWACQIVLNNSNHNCRFRHNNSNSSSANRIFTPTQSSINMPPNGIVVVVYNQEISRWNLFEGFV